MQELLVAGAAPTVDSAADDHPPSIDAFAGDAADAPESHACPLDDALLLQVFRFRHKPPSTTQDDTECARLARRFHSFVNAAGVGVVQVEGLGFSAVDPLADDRRVPLHQFAEGELRALKRACAVLTGTHVADGTPVRGTVWVAKWFPKYGCALQAEVLGITSVALKLVILDGWEHVKHFPADGTCVHSAISKAVSVLNCGLIRSELLRRLLDEIYVEIEKAKPRTGVQRSAAFNDIGHQKTPQFIAALVRIAKSRVAGESGSPTRPVIRGGTTDVGLHTGGQSRDTCWPLVRAVMQQNLPGTGVLFEKAMVQFKLSLAQARADYVRSIAGASVVPQVNLPAFWEAAEDAFSMLQTTVLEVVALVQRGYDGSALNAACADVRQRIDDAVTEATAQVAAYYTLPAADAFNKMKQTATHPMLTKLAYEDVFSSSGDSSYDMRQHARQQIGLYAFLNAETCSASTLNKWLAVMDSTSGNHLVVLRTIETFIFSKSTWLHAFPRGRKFNPKKIKSIIQVYDTHLAEWTSDPLSSSLLDVEQRSRSLLVKWTTFCLAHMTFAKSYSQLEHYGIALSWENLEVVVLRDKAAIDTLSHVATYIRKWNQRDYQALFDLSNPAPTAHFARAFASESEVFMQRYTEEHKRLGQRVAFHWKAIENKKKMAATLQAEIMHIDEVLRHSDQMLREEQARLSTANKFLPHHLQHWDSPTIYKYTTDINNMSSWRYTKERALEDARTMPGFVVNPLPRDRAQALEVLFFLDIPEDIGTLWELCLEAQRALAAPKLPPFVVKSLQDDSAKTTWHDYYSSYSSTTYSSDARLVGYVTDLVVPSSYGPWSIDEIQNQEDFAARCIWYPSSTAGTRTYWKEPSGTIVNPFLIARGQIVDYFTPQLPFVYKNLQWAVAYPGGEQRGNLVYSKLSEPLPENFDKHAFIQFGMLRAFPNQQIRRICHALKDNLLPWSHPCVVAVVRQALFQVGELTDDEFPSFVWKSDVVGEEGVTMISSAIEQVANQLDLTPRNYEDVPLLSELAAFASQIAHSSTNIVTKFANMCRRWAGDVRKQYQSNRSISSAEHTELRAKECLLYGYALQSYAFGSLISDALIAVGELVVLFRNALMFASGSKLLAKLQELEVVVGEIMTRRVVELVDVFKSNESLSRLVQLVSTSAPADLVWTNSTFGAKYTTFFDAIDAATGTHYAINLFTGTVLIDGSSSGGLPSDIRSNPRYRELFGEQDFEVAFSKGAYRSTHPIDGRYFDFTLLGDELRVREVCYGASKKAAEKVLDLCPVDWLAALGAVLPAQILALHSLWYWLEEDCVLVRPLDAVRTTVDFVIRFVKDEYGSERIKCVQVPVVDKGLPPQEILKRTCEYLSFVSIDARLSEILQKFDTTSFIHVLREPSEMLKVSFPRFRLTFLLNEQNELASNEYDGYILDQCQQFEDAFPLFSRYLVIRLKDPKAVSTSKPLFRILVPFGNIIRASSGMIDVELSDDPSAKLGISVFESHHRFRTLSTESIPSRLQLCAVLASAGANIPSKCFSMTGSEAALQVLQGCFFGTPLSRTEKGLLANVCEFTHREPGLKILANSILHKSERCSFLAMGREDAGFDDIECSDELDEYSAMCMQFPERNPLRSRLKKVEEGLLLGGIPEHDMLVKLSPGPLVELGVPPVKTGYVCETEALFSRFLCSAERDGDPPLLPLSQLKNDAMGEEMNAELLESWKAYHNHSDKQLATSPNALSLMCALVLKDVKKKRQLTESYLFAAVDATRGSTCSRLLHLINYIPTPTVSDIVRSSFDDDIFLHLASRLTLGARLAFRTTTLQFMELCVLEDKLERLVQAGQQALPNSDTFFLDELSGARQWKSAEYPFWLAFEVEGRLQIRHEQYIVAKHLIESPGSVCQMNMGRGKTRVILPMLFLYYSHRHRNRIVRAHFLTPLLSETRQFMHRNLSAGILQLNFVEHPYHRNIEIDARRLGLLREDLEDAKACGRFLIVAPEHRMSLELKLLDLKSSAHEHRNDMIRTLEELLDHRQYIDVLDESDAVLDHKYHLIYAVGDPQKLENGESRWLASEALLRALIGGQRTEGELRELLLQPHVCFRSAEYATRLGGYDGLRLNATVGDKQQVRQKLKEALVLELFAEPPMSFKWLRAYSWQSELAKNQLVLALTDPSVSLDEALAGVDPGIMRFRSELLALRGMLAFGILEHCLEKRHRVEYGLPDAKTRPKRMAIPFRAADIPSERSEFSHPEVGITLTLLGYYHSGLSTGEVKEALRQLLLLGPSEQDQFYSMWYESIKHGLPDELVDEFPRNPSQLSPNDTRQFAILYRVFRYTMEVVNFFTNTCVFPSDTTQYPLRLTRSAWNIAGGDWNLGFSGTNDNHRLLPLSVCQREPEDPSLLGTNGRMIDRILRVFQGFEEVETDAASLIPWQMLLQLALSKQVHALIDTGALLAGVLNNDAAMYLLDLDGFAFAGVTYYDTRKSYDCWVVLDASSRIVTPLKTSTLSEDETFVIFDDARSRGSDMKLKADAVAVLTLGPKLTKDKLMQGAGRMRQLGCDQTLWFVGLSEVAQNILQVCRKDHVASVGAVDVLDWVMENTRSEAVLGLLEWTNSGLHFSKCQQDPDAELRKEDWSVEALYAPGHRAQLINNIVQSRARELFGDEVHSLNTMTDAICARGCTYGLDEEVLVTSHDEECERELHNEQFEERENKTDHATVLPVSEATWDFEQALLVGSVHELAGFVNIVALGDFVRRDIRPAVLSEMDWNRSQVFGTSNFFSTVTSPSFGDFVGDFSRLIEVILLFEDDTKLLLSEFEADVLLRLLWRRSGAPPRCAFVNLSSAVDEIDGASGSAALAYDVSWRTGSSTGGVERAVAASLTTMCQLYNGETMFTKRANPAVEEALRVHLQPLRQRERAFQEFAIVRGNLLRWRYSFLHTLCHEMDLGDFVSPEVCYHEQTRLQLSAPTKDKKAVQAERKAARKQE